MRGYRVIRQFVELAAVTSLVGMVIVVSIQVLARFALPSAPAWTEELSRVFFVYSVAFGIGAAVDRDELVRLSLLENYLSQSLVGHLKLIMRLVVIAVSLVIARYALPFVQIGHVELSPVLGIRMSWAFASSVVVMLIAGYFTLVRVMADPGEEGRKP
ncbi:MAG: TRAP transporter small permease subunit [Bacteroidota bacterium]